MANERRRGRTARPRRFAPPPPKKLKKRRFERFILGGLMSLVAWFLERRILRALKKKKPAELAAQEAELEGLSPAVRKIEDLGATAAEEIRDQG